MKKCLLFGEVLKNQIKKNFTKEKSLQKKRHLAQAISGAVIKKYKMYSEVFMLASRRSVLITKPVTGNELKKRLRARKSIQTFLEMDENTRQCPGKKTQ